MPILYVKSGCAFCARVLAQAELLGVELELKNIADEGVAEELVARGGMQQVPYLVDEEKGVEMYESDAIVAYLNERFSAAA